MKIIFDADDEHVKSGMEVIIRLPEEGEASVTVRGKDAREEAHLVGPAMLFLDLLLVALKLDLKHREALNLVRERLDKLNAPEPPIQQVGELK